MDDAEEYFLNGPEHDNEGHEPFSVGIVVPKRETAKALLVLTAELDEMWIPKSVIHADSSVWKTGQTEGELIVKTWWAEKQGLI